MSSYDLVVRNGTVIDGSGSLRRRADVATVGGRIAAVGKVDGSGHREIDAEGHVVAPGFVDAHTHMDAQVFWDDLGTSSCWHGVTTAVMGNCGFTLAPAKRLERALVVRNLERAEDISAEAMSQGINWTWESFAEYLDAVEATPKGINYAASIGHSALRTWAMGERAFSEPATVDDIGAMGRELVVALRAGAVGFTTSRSVSHMTSDDRPVASRLASWDEVTALVEIMARVGQGTFQLAPERHAEADGRQEYERRLQELTLSTGVTVTFGGITASNTDLVDDTVARGGRMYMLTNCRGASGVFSFRTSMMFDDLAGWRDLRRLPLEDQRRLLGDEGVRQRLVEAVRTADFGGDPERPELGRPDFGRIVIMLSPYGANPSVGEVARQRGVDPVEVILDVALEHDFDVFFMMFVADQDEAQLLPVLKNENTAMTFSDSGAHVNSVIDSSIQSYLLSSWVRERQLLTLEEAIQMMTSRPAKVFRLPDRGLLREGFAADITIFDPDTVAADLPRVAFDLPGGARRVTQTGLGYKAVIVNGEVFLTDGQPSDARSGQLLRSRSKG